MNMTSSKRIAVVGGGLAGIGCVKTLRENLMEPMCFEKTSNIGGLWRYRKEDEVGVPSVMSTIILNNSKELGAFSNFPPPEDYPNFMQHHKFLSYILDFCHKFDLLKHFICNREVITVERADDYEETGRWVVTVKDTETGELSRDVYDGVMICTGQFSYPKMPEFPGMEKFQGRIIHSHSLKTFESFAGKRAIVVGTGCSALDAAVEISNVANQVYLSVRTPSWIMPRVGAHGLPYDYTALRRSGTFMQNILPTTLCSNLIEKTMLNRFFNHKLYGIEPKYHVLCRDPLTNDVLPAKLISGSILIRKNIKEINENSVIFEDAAEETEIDVIIMATGYELKFSYLEEDVLAKDDSGEFQLYKLMYPPHLKHPTLAFIGLILPFGPGIPPGELQTRFAAHLLSGKGTLPSKEVMMKDIQKRFHENSIRYSYSEKISFRVDNVPYMDEIASEFGAKPNLWKMAITDPKLYFACIFGPFVPYQYRLEGPNKWEGAREAILTAPSRMKAGLCGRKKCTEKTPSDNFVLKSTFLISLVIVLAALKESPVKYLFLFAVLYILFTVKKKSGRLLISTFMMPFFLPFKLFIANVFISFLISLGMILASVF